MMGNEVFESYVLKFSSTVFVHHDKEGNIIKANAFTAKLIGFDPVGKHLKDIIVSFAPHFDMGLFLKENEVPQRLNVTTATGIPQTYYFKTIKISNGEFYLFGELNQEENESMRKEMLSLNNNLQNMARELHKKNAELETLNNQKNHFLGIAAHDLRNPIGIILSYSSFLLST